MSYGTLLGDLEAISVAIQDDKITARKKAADRLNDLLQNANIVSLLCKQTVISDNSKGTNGSSFTWNNLYRATFRYLLKEADRLQKDNYKSNKAAVSSQSQGYVVFIKSCICLGLKGILSSQHCTIPIP